MIRVRDIATVYITDSTWGEMQFANQVQSQNTFRSLNEISPATGFFRHGDYLGLVELDGSEEAEAFRFPVAMRLIIRSLLKLGGILDVRLLGMLTRDVAYGIGLAMRMSRISGPKAVYSRASITTNYILGKLSRRLRIEKMVVECHNYEPDLPDYFRWPFEEPVFRSIYRSVVRNSDEVVTITVGLAEVLARVLGRDSFGNIPAIIPSGHDIDLSIPKEVCFSDNETVRMAYVGFFFKYRGVEPLIGSLLHLPANYRLTMVGGLESEVAELESRYASLVQSGRLVLKGRMPHAQIREFLSAEADIALVPLPKTGRGQFSSPVKLFEYMAVGLPIVGPDLPVIREILEDGRNAVLVDPEDPASIAAGIRRLASDPALARAVGRAAWEDSRRYSYASRAKRILELLLSEPLIHQMEGLRR